MDAPKPNATPIAKPKPKEPKPKEPKPKRRKTAATPKESKPVRVPVCGLCGEAFGHAATDSLAQHMLHYHRVPPTAVK